MEVHPGSGVHYVGDSDCPHQGTGTSFVYNEDPNCIKQNQEQVDVKVDESQEERQVGSVDELPTPDEAHSNGDLYFDFDLDGHKSSGLHDSEDESLNAEYNDSPSLMNSHLTMDDMSQQYKPMAVWVKWRGVWQAGIRCVREDWPLSTLKAKPTHERKEYIVIFFPRKRNYSWADVRLVRPINEFPQPIAYKAHRVGRKIVKDLTIARQFIMQKLAISMINVIDQLRCKALIETARSVTVWKEFAVEAYRCKCYSDLGRVLLKLQNIILQSCLNSDWLQHSLQSWTQRCQSAHSAELIEMLKEELTDSIKWNEVNSISMDSQPELGAEWKNWKHEVLKSFSTLHSACSNAGETEQHKNGNSPISPGLQSSSRKRAKLEVRRAEPHPPVVEPQGPRLSIEIDSGFFDTTSPTTLEQPRGQVPLQGGAPVDQWGEIVVEARNSMQVTPKSVDPESKNRQCIAFIKAKGRQCVRWANEGDVYCCIHLASRFVSSTPKPESVPQVDTAMCGGTTVLGTKCKHRSLIGSSFCKKHRPDKTPVFSSPDNKRKRHHEDSASVNRLELSDCKEMVLVGEVGPVQADPISIINNNKNSHDYEMSHCIGSCTEDGSGPCLEIPKRHLLYCEKHLPSWLKRARNGKSRIVSKEVFMNLFRDSHTREQKIHLHQACELFYRLFKSILSLRNPVPKEIQLQWAISEASKDVRVGELLSKLVCSEKQRLERLWGFNADKTSPNSTIPTPDIVNNIINGDEGVIKCKLCLVNFGDEQMLGSHWMESHKKEAQWHFRGYVCAICLDSFTNKKVLEAHVQERHSVQFVKQCMLYQCIPCGSHFGNPDELWLHVLSFHASNFKFQIASQQYNIDKQNSNPSEPITSHKIETPNSDGSFRKFICKFCGIKFDLLPDLGRHHQAAHMGPHSAAVNPRLQKRGIRFYAHRLKSGRLTRPRFKKGLGATSYKIRKKRLQAVSNSVSFRDLSTQSRVTAPTSLGRLAESHCSAVARILFSEIKRTESRPSNFEILSFARSACCRIRLQVLLEEKYKLLPDRIYLKAAKLCSEHNITVDWHQDGFVCPKGCKPITSVYLAESEVMPILDGVVETSSRMVLDNVTSEWAMDECHYVIDSRHFRKDMVQRSIVLCDDISFGKESVPILCTVDENLLGSLQTISSSSSMPWETFIYITKPLLDQSPRVEAESFQLGCSCADSTCSSQNCDHVYLFDNDYEDAKDIYGKSMNGRFPYDKHGRLILEEGYLVYECNHRCRCSRSCQNRNLQNGIRVKLEVFKTEKKGWAVRAGEAIQRGTFICEYVGEVIDEEEANKRRSRYGTEGCSYFYDIDAQSNDMSRLIEEQAPYVIDARNYGNISRFINHSCSSNLTNHQVLVESMDCQLAHIGFYACQDIAFGEELTFNYGYKLMPGEGCECHCGASNCKGRLY